MEQSKILHNQQNQFPALSVIVTVCVHLNWGRGKPRATNWSWGISVLLPSTAS